MTNILELRSVRGTGGGPEKTILSGAERHDRSRFAITVCYIRDLRDGIFGIDTRARALDIDYVEIRERHSFDVRIWPALVRLMRDRRIDIVHGHDYKTNLLAWRLGSATGAIPIATSHGWTGETFRERRIYYPLDRQVLRRLPRVVAVSSDVARTLVAAGADPSRVTVLLNGIDPEAFQRSETDRAHIRMELGVTAGHQVIGAVGRLEEQKRFDLLLEAFARLRPDHPMARLVIVGDGSLRASLVERARSLGLGEVCQFVGHRLDIAALHSGFDLFVQSSEYEGTPNAVLEAMAMDTPLVATDVGGTRELAWPDEHGLIVPPHDVPALAGAIAAVLAAPEAARTRALAARARIEGALSFAERTRRLEGIYEALVAERDQARVPSPAGKPVGAHRA